MNTSKNILRVFVIAAVVVGTIYACDDFLTQPAQGQLDPGVLANKEGVEGSLIAAYSMLDGYAEYGGWGTASSNWTFGSVASDNAYKGSEEGDQQPVADFELYLWNTGGAQGYLNDKWRVTYDGINRANATISALAETEDIAESERQRIEGESRFLRAHYHFEAWKMWKNVPYYTEADEDFRKPNTGTDPIARVLEDLDAAIGLLPETQDEVGRVTQWTARAYKGRVQAYSGDYAGALTTLRNVVDNGPYELEDNFYDVFNANNDNGSETVLAYQASVNDGEPGGDNGNYPDRLNFPHSGSPFGCCGFHQPTQNLVNAFKVDASGLPLPLSSPDTWNDDDANFAGGDMTPVDPRLDWTVGRDDVPFLDYGLHQPGWIRARSYSGPYSAKKTIPAQSADATSNVGWSSFQLHSQNLHLYRYADVLLLLAEAEVEAGTIDNAREIVNQLRERAGQAAQGPVDGPIAVPIDDPSITWADYEIGTYDIPWTDQNFAREAVQLERRLELAMEGHRLFDLRRWGRAQDVLNNFISVEQSRRSYLSAAATVDGKHEMYPIPTFQIQLSEVDGEQRLVQNDGW